MSVRTAPVIAWAYARRRPRQALLVCAGIIVASALFVSAALVGDSLRASIRRSVAQQLGPVDEEVVRPGVDPAAIDAAITHASGGSGLTTLPLVAMNATVRGRDFVARVAQAQVVEVDFGAAQRFGGGSSRSGVTGNTPSGNTAVLSRDLSDALAIAETHRVTVYAFGQARTFTIDTVLPRRGIAGLRTPLSPAGSASYNIFVPPGTIASMLGASAGAAPSGQATPEAIVAVTHARPNVVPTGLEAAARTVGADVRPLRQQTLDDANRRSRSVTGLFRSLALFGALAGLALLVLALAALARDRRRAIATLRAHGLSRRGVMTALTLEGSVYALVGVVLGVLCGWALGEIVVLVGRHVFANANSANVALVFSARLTTIVLAAAIVFVVALVTIGLSAIAASRRNIVSAMRRPSEPNNVPPALRRAIGLVSVVVAVSLLALLPRPGTALTGTIIVVEGLVLTAAVLAVVATQMRRPRLGRSSHRHRASSLAAMYARQPSWRTALVAATYALLLFLITVLFTVRGLYERDTSALARRMGGQSTLEVSSNAAAPVPPADVARLPGVVGVKAAATMAAQLTSAGPSQTRDVTAVGIDSSWIGSGSPPLTANRGTSGEDPYRVVVDDPSQVLVGADLYADRQSGFPRGIPHVGDHIDIVIPATGAHRTLTVAGIVTAGRFDAADHVYVARSLLDDLLGKPAVSNLLFVDTTPATNATVLAAIIDGTHLPNGAYARSFVRLARESTSAQTQFLEISAGYAAVGLVAAIIAIAVVMIDRVRERRRQIASLRALGAPATVVRRSVRIETGLIALVGMVIGVVCGLVLTWRFDRIDGFAAARGISVPFVPLAIALVILLLASVFAATSAARGLARLQPARVLRGDE